MCPLLVTVFELWPNKIEVLHSAWWEVQTVAHHVWITTRFLKNVSRHLRSYTVSIPTGMWGTSSFSHVNKPKGIHVYRSEGAYMSISLASHLALITPGILYRLVLLYRYWSLFGWTNHSAGGGYRDTANLASEFLKTKTFKIVSLIDTSLLLLLFLSDKCKWLF